MPRPPYCMNMAPTTAGNVSTLKISTGNNGCSAIQPSHHVATAKITTPAQKVTGMYGVLQPCGALGDAVKENTIRTSPDTIKTVPGQSILIPSAARSSVSDGMDAYARKNEIALRIAPMKKYQRQLISCAASPAKKIPTKKPRGAQAP